MGSNNKKSQKHRDDFRIFGSWIKKRIQYKLRKEAYIIQNKDMEKIGGLINIINWLTPKLSKQSWFTKGIEPMLTGDSSGDQIQGKMVPLNVTVNDNSKAILPYKLIDEVIEKASFILILNRCMCRIGMKCQDYPIEFGCMFIGEGARYLSKEKETIGREASVQEAKDHVRKASELGLVPIAAYVPLEAKVFGVPDGLHKRFFEFCFCCPCCCFGIRNLKHFSPGIRDKLENIGFTAKALPDCKGCMKCVEICPVNAINKNGSKVWVNEDICVACGLCEYACKHNAIQLIQIESSRGPLLDYFKGVNIDIT